MVIESQRDARFLTATRRKNVAVIIGDATVLDVLRQAHAARARAVVAATNNDLVNIEIALLARELQPSQRVVVRLNDPQLSEMLRQSADIRFALSLPDLAAPAFVAALFGDRVLTVFLVRRRLIAVVELVVPRGDNTLDGQMVGTLAKNYGLVPLALRSVNEAESGQLLDHRLAAGDRLTVLTSLNDLVRLLGRERD